MSHYSIFFFSLCLTIIAIAIMIIIICGTYIIKSFQPVIPITAIRDTIIDSIYGIQIMHLPTEFLKAIRCNIIEMPMKAGGYPCQAQQKSNTYIMQNTSKRLHPIVLK